MVEFLENRLVPAVHIWSGGGEVMNPNWPNSANWSSNSAPAPGETVDLTFPTGQGMVLVSSGEATQYILAGPQTVTACGSFSLSAAAADQYGNIDTNYNGTTEVTESPDSGSMWRGQEPPWYVDFQNGQASLSNPDIQAPCLPDDQLPLTVTYTFHQASEPPPLIPDASITVTFVSGPFSRVHPTDLIVGPASQKFNFTTPMMDNHGYRVRDYNGTVHFTSSDQGTVTWTSTDPDPGVILPADYTFQPGDQGMVTFPGGVTLITLGDQTLTATDTTSGITSSATVTVTPGPSRAQDRGKGSPLALDAASRDQMARDTLFASRPAKEWPARSRAVLAAPARAHHGTADFWADPAWWGDLPEALIA